jgi:hypothetical protein
MLNSTSAGLKYRVLDYNANEFDTIDWVSCTLYLLKTFNAVMIFLSSWMFNRVFIFHIYKSGAKMLISIFINHMIVQVFDFCKTATKLISKWTQKCIRDISTFYYENKARAQYHVTLLSEWKEALRAKVSVFSFAP